MRLIIMEALLINGTDDSLLNRDAGLDLPGYWTVELNGHGSACSLELHMPFSFYSCIQSLCLIRAAAKLPKHILIMLI